MMSEKIIGRDLERQTLDEIFDSNKAEFLAIYGRRRIGKTYLIRQFFKKKNCYFFNSTGMYTTPMHQQIKEFTKQISKTFYFGTELKEKNNWLETFELLTITIQQQTDKNKKIILFFDEFPWMATPRSRLLQALDYYWNQYWSQDPRIKLIICGSSASWIIKNIVNNKGGLHNRLTQTMLLESLSLKETQRFLHYNGVKLGEKQIVQLYMVMGGVPFYLTKITSGLSATEIIDRLAFAKNSFLLNEFNNLYAALFKNSAVYIELVRKIASKRYGVSQEELFSTKNKISKGGAIVGKLQDLEDAGFIVRFKPYQHKKKGIHYKVVDEYSLFYFNWIEPLKETLLTRGLRRGYWEKQQISSAWHSWSGYAFEEICYKHLDQIGSALKLSPTAVPYAWRYQPKKGCNESGAQIDLLFDRDDDAITVCEIKYTNKPFVLDKQYAKNLLNKIDVFTKRTKTTKEIFLSFVSASGLKPSMYSEEMLVNVVTLHDLFQ